MLSFQYPWFHATVHSVKCEPLVLSLYGVWSSTWAFVQHFDLWGITSIFNTKKRNGFLINLGIIRSKYQRRWWKRIEIKYLNFKGKKDETFYRLICSLPSSIVRILQRDHVLQIKQPQSFQKYSNGERKTYIWAFLLLVKINP